MQSATNKTNNILTSQGMAQTSLKVLSQNKFNSLSANITRHLCLNNYFPDEK